MFKLYGGVPMPFKRTYHKSFKILYEAGSVLTAKIIVLAILAYYIENTVYNKRREVIIPFARSLTCQGLIYTTEYFAIDVCY